jgi:hypothetical protein
MPITKIGIGRKRAKRNTVMCSLRIERQLKEGLQQFAKREGRSLSSLIAQVLKDFMKSHKADLPLKGIQEDKRRFPRKEVVLPGRWRTKSGGEIQEYDVLVKNISADGAYMEHINGHHHNLFHSSRPTAWELVLRLPGSREPTVFDCVPKHCHITKECLSMGLQFTGNLEEDKKNALEYFITESAGI